MTEADKGGTTGAANPSSDMDRAKHRMEEERRAAEDLARDARGAAGGLGEKAKQAVYRQGEEMREEATSHLRHFADAIKSAGDELAEKEPGVISDVVREAAYGLERFTDTLSRKQPSEIFGAMRDFGRRHPGAFLAGSMLIGFAVTRFATTSNPSRRYESGGSGDEYGSREGSSYEPRHYEGAYEAGNRARPGSTGPGGYPGAGASTGLGGTGASTGLGGSGSSTGPGAGTGYGSTSPGVAGSGTSGISGTGSTGSSGAGSSGSAASSGARFSSSGAGGASPGSTSKPGDTAGVSMGGPGQGVTGVPTGSDVPRKPSSTNKTGGQ